MRIGQLQSFTPEELGYLLHVAFVVEPTSSSLDVVPKSLLYFKHDPLVAKVAKQEPNLTDEGKKIHQSVISKLNKTWIQEIEEHINYENTASSASFQTEFQF